MPFHFLNTRSSAIPTTPSSATAAILAVVVALSAAGSSVHAQDAVSEDETAIRDVFAAYKDALAIEDGDAAAGLVTSNSIAYYGYMRDHALFSAPEVVQELELFDQLQVLLLRLRLPADSLEMLNAREIFSVGIKRGWTDQESTARLELGTVNVYRDEALTTALQGQMETPMELFRFVREDGKWRQDLIHTLRVAGQMIGEAFEQAEMDKAEFVTTMLQYSEGFEIGPEVWEPLRERPAGGRD